MFNVRERKTLREKLTQIVTERIDELEIMFPKLDVGNEDFLSFVGKLLKDDRYFCLRCRLTEQGRESVEELGERFSNRFVQILDHEKGIIEIAINDSEKLNAFLGSENPHIEDGSVQLVKR
jgi:hypothetical protein